MIYENSKFISYNTLRSLVNQRHNLLGEER